MSTVITRWNSPAVVSAIRAGGLLAALSTRMSWPSRTGSNIAGRSAGFDARATRTATPPSSWPGRLLGRCLVAVVGEHDPGVGCGEQSYDDGPVDASGPPVTSAVLARSVLRGMVMIDGRGASSAFGPLAGVLGGRPRGFSTRPTVADPPAGP